MDKILNKMVELNKELSRLNKELSDMVKEETGILSLCGVYPLRPQLAVDVACKDYDAALDAFMSLMDTNTSAKVAWSDNDSVAWRGTWCGLETTIVLPNIMPNKYETAVKWLNAKLEVDREFLEPDEVNELERTIKALKEMI